MAINYERFKSLSEFKDYIMQEKGCDRVAAAKWAMNNVPKESYFQEKIKKYLEKTYPNSFTRKYNAGNYSQGGVPDIMFIHNGRYYGFEVKRPFFGTVSQLQKVTIEQIRKAGGVAEVVTYVSEVDEIIKRESEE